MLTTLKNAFKIKEIRQKLFFTFVMMVVIRIGSQLPVPGVNSAYFKSFFEQNAGGALDFFDAIIKVEIRIFPTSMRADRCISSSSA